MSVARAQESECSEGWYCCDNQTSKYTVAVATDSCDPIIQACRNAIQAQQEAIGACKKTLGDSMAESVVAEQQIKEADAKLQSWTRNPFFTTTLGALIGALAAGYVLRK